MQFSQRLWQVIGGRFMGRLACVMLSIAVSILQQSPALHAQTAPQAYSTQLLSTSTNAGGGRLTIVDALAINPEYNLDPPPTTAVPIAVQQSDKTSLRSTENVDPDSQVDLAERVARLEQALAEANERNKKQEQKDKEAKEKSDRAKVAAELKGASSADGSNEKWNVKLGGHVQLDYITWANADPAIAETENYFSYRRLRLVADGTGYGTFDFRLQNDPRARIGIA